MSAKTNDDVARIMARPGTFAKSFVRLMITDDQKNPDRYALYLSQAGSACPTASIT
jgi:putative endopeptidase